MSPQTREELERKMLEQVGILPKKQPFLGNEDPYRVMFEFFSRFAKISSPLDKDDTLANRVKHLEETVEELKREKEIKRLPSKADLVYLKFKAELEKEHFRKIVAIDLESEQIVGIGNSILEAYQEAKKNSSREQFSFRRVGFDYVHRL